MSNSESNHHREMPPTLTFSQIMPERLTVLLSGMWTLDQPIPDPDEIKKILDHQSFTGEMLFDTEKLVTWDSGLVIFLIKVKKLAEKYSLNLNFSGLPEGAQKLLQLTSAVPKREGAERKKSPGRILDRIGTAVVSFAALLKDQLAFIGEIAIAFSKLFTRQAAFRFSDLLLIIQECGIEALPIVTLISVLIGLILAFVGAVQLAMFGAQVYVADLVAIAMLREMGAMMTGIIMAGRTGAAFAAQLGTMQVNEEIDALQTFGLKPVEFLVLPRMLALSLMMPLLCIYSDLLGIIGGAIVGMGAFDITLVQYFEQTGRIIHLNHFLLGVIKSVIFGMIIALTGCRQGMLCGRSATDVGNAATSAVVTSIVMIIAVDGLFAVLTNVLGI